MWLLALILSHGRYRGYEFMFFGIFQHNFSVVVGSQWCLHGCISSLHLLLPAIMGHRVCRIILIHLYKTEHFQFPGDLLGEHEFYPPRDAATSWKRHWCGVNRWLLFSPFQRHFSELATLGLFFDLTLILSRTIQAQNTPNGSAKIQA